MKLVNSYFSNLNFKLNKNFKKYRDYELMEFLKAGSTNGELAFKEIYNRYASTVHAYCMRVFNNPEQSEDVFQETFIRFYQSVTKEKNEDTIELPKNFNVPGFLITIARNYCLNLKRKEKKEVSVENYDFFEYEHEGYERKELLELIKTALDLLEFDYREAFVLREYSGLSYEEIAESTKTSTANAKARVFRAKLKIKEILKPYLLDLQNKS